MKSLNLIISMLIANSSFCQLSGTYTVGGTNPDFIDFVSAVDSLKNNNTSGPVTILIRPGTYIGPIQYSGGGSTFRSNHTVTFQSETGLNDVLITSPANITIEMHWNSSFSLKKITFKHINFETTNTVANPHFSYAMKLVNFIAEFDSCNFFGGLYLDRFFIPGSTFTVKNCTVQCPNRIQFFSGGIVEDNVFLSDGFEQTKGTIYYYRNFQQGRLNVTVGEIIDNEIDKFQVSHRGPYLFSNNKVNGEFWLSFGVGNSVIIGNRMFGPTYVSKTDNTVIINNVFNSFLEYNYGSFTKIINNNFGPNSYLNLNYSSADIRNNLFSLGVYGSVYSCTIENNNYYLLNNNPNNYNIFGGQFDNNPFVFNPMFIDTINLVATNPSLIGIGSSNSLITHDIDSLVRPINSTLGANEICYSSQSTDTIFMTCGDSIPLNICNLDVNSSYKWTPTIGLSDSTSYRPYASPSTNITYMVSDSSNTPLDSVTIIIVPFNPTTEKDTSILCGDSLKLFSSFHPQASYSWSPSIGLTDSSSRVTYAKPPVSTDYILNINIPNCGSYFDTVSITVDTLPNAQWYIVNINNYDVTFQNFSTCYDSIFWTFGDGDTSSLSYIQHSYDTSGLYNVCLIAFNSYGSDTICGNVWINDPVGIKEKKSIENAIKVFPNPTVDFVNFEFDKFPLELIIFNTQGKVILNKNITENSFKLKVNHLESGIYFYNCIFKNTRNTGKFIIK